MDTKICYLYNTDTGEYKGQSIAYESPLEPGVYVVPPNSTFKEPFPYQTGYVSCFINNDWVLKIDNRGGFQINLTTLEITTVDYIGAVHAGFQIISQEVAADFKANPLKYKVVDGVFKDISDTPEYQEMVANIGKYYINLTTLVCTYIDKVMKIPAGCQVITKEIHDDFKANPDKYAVVGGVFKDISDTPEYKAKKTAERKAAFEASFLELETNKNYRLCPKGYANAQQSIDTINNIVNILGSLTAEISSIVLFYKTPDFSKPEQCTEEWLIQHQFSAQPMTKEEWTLFYIDFTTKYTRKMYQQELQSQQIDYSTFTVAQLKAMADERGISYPSNILKADLISLLENN